MTPTTYGKPHAATRWQKLLDAYTPAPFPTFAPKAKVVKPVVYGCALPPKPTLFQRIVQHLARLLLRLALLVAPRTPYVPPKRKPSYERRLAAREAARAALLRAGSAVGVKLLAAGGAI